MLRDADRRGTKGLSLNKLRAFRLLKPLAMGLAIVLLVKVRSAQAAPSCGELTSHASRLLQNKAICRDLGNALNALKAVDAACSKEPDFQTQRTLLQAALREDRCLCDTLDSAIAATRTRPIAQLKCDDALGTLATLRASTGRCQSSSSLGGQQELEKRLVARRDTACETECGVLAQRVEAAQCKGVAQDASRCSACKEAEARVCRRACAAAAPAPPNDDLLLLSELHQLLGTLNSRISNDPRCAEKSEPCRELEYDRLRALTSFLRLLQDARVPNESRAKFQDEALRALRVMGIEASMLDYLRLHSSEELQGMSELSKVVSNQELRQYLVAQLGPLNDQRLQPMLDALRAGASLEQLFATAQAMTPDARAEFYQAAGAVGFREAGIRHDYLQQIVNAGLDVILPEAAVRGQCTNCGHFWGKLQGELNASQRVGIIPASNVSTELGKRLEQRSRICSGQVRGAPGPGCGPILALAAAQQSDGSLQIEPRLRYIIRYGSSALVNELSLEPQLLASNATQREQEAQARVLAAAVIYRFNQLLATPYRSQSPEIEASSCGANVKVDQNPNPAPRAGGRLRLIGAACSAPAFKHLLLEKLAAHGLTSRLALETNRESVGNGSNNAAAMPEQPLKCTLTVLAPDGRKNLVAAYSLSTIVFDEPGCSTTREERFAYVARMAAWQLAAYFSGIAPAEAKPKAPPFAHALYFSGARQLEHSKGKHGWGWAVGEAGLIVAGAGLAILAVNARNQSAGTAADTRRANAFLDSAYVSFGLVIPLRLMAGAFCCGEGQ